MSWKFSKLFHRNLRGSRQSLKPECHYMFRVACVVWIWFDRDAIPVSRRLSWNSGNVEHGSGPGRSHEKKPVRVRDNWQQNIPFPVPVPMSASVAVSSLGQWLWHERMSPLQFSRETQWLMACNQWLLINALKNILDTEHITENMIKLHGVAVLWCEQSNTETTTIILKFSRG